jgi:hypothetical protein
VRRTRSGASNLDFHQLPVTPQLLRWDRDISNELFLSRRTISSVVKVSIRDFQTSEDLKTDDGSLERSLE